MISSPDNRASWLSLPRTAIMIALVFATTLGSQGLAQKVDGLPNSLTELEEAVLARQQWREHVRAEKRRIRELTAQRRINPEVKSFRSEERWASERALSDMTLQRGDIVVTDKGAFEFVGSAEEERMPADFVPLGKLPR